MSQQTVQWVVYNLKHVLKHSPIYCQGCTFQNFFYELNTLIRVPEQAQSYSITIEDSTFLYWNTCGAIFSNNFQYTYNVLQSPTSTYYTSFDSQFLRYFLMMSQSSKESIGKSYFNYQSTDTTTTSQSITFKDNNVQYLNTLKQTEQALDKVRYEFKNRGLIIDLLQNYTGDVLIQGNTIKNIYFDYNYDNNPCFYILSDTWDQDQVVFQDNSDDDRYQQTHAFSLSVNSTSTIRIYDNTITYTQMIGPLIYIYGGKSATNMIVAIINNKFSYNTALINTNILAIDKYKGTNSVDTDTSTSLSDAATVLMYGGGTLIQDNTFSDIIGCNYVDSGLMSFLVTTDYQTYSTDTTLDTFYQQDKSYVSSATTQITTTQYIEAALDLYKTSSSYYTTISYNSYTITVNRLFINFTQNTYENCAFGSTTYSSYFYGALINFQNILAVKFKGESFKNIGGWSVEQMQAQYLALLGYTYNYEYDLKQPLLSTYGAGDTSLVNQFYEQYTGCCLININVMSNFTIESSTFDNIWNFDLKDSFSTTNALIFYLQNYVGTFVIGDYSSTTTFKNLVGIFNSYTVSKYTSWDPTNTNFEYSKDSPEGFSSSLFNVESSTNSFDSIALVNLDFYNLYGKYQKSATTGSKHAIIKAYKSGTQTSVTLYNLKIYSSVVIDSVGYFGLYGQEVIIKNVEVYSIGDYWSPVSSLDYSNIQDNDPPESNGFFAFSVEPKSGSETYIYVEDSTFQNMTCSSPAIFNFDVVNSGTTYFPEIIFIDSITAKYINGTTSGSIFNFKGSSNSHSYKVNVKNAYFTQNYGDKGLFNVEGSLYQIYFEDSYFTKNSGDYAKVFYLTGTLTYFYVYSSYFYDVYYSTSEVQLDLKFDPEDLMIDSSLIYATAQTDIYISDCFVKNVNYAQYGGFLQLQSKSEATISDSTFKDMSAYYGGSIYANLNSKVSISGSYFDRSNGYIAGVIYCSDLSYLYIDDSSFTDNFALYSAVFRISTSSYFKILDSNFFYNYASQKDSIGQIIESSTASYFNNSEFTYNYFSASTGKIGLEIKASSYIYFWNCLFQENKGTVTTPNLYIIDSSDIFVNASTFYNSRGYTSQLTNVFGNFMYLIANTSVTVNNTSFKNGYAKYGGAIYLIGDSMLSINASTFTNGYSVQGGAITAISFTYLNISKCTFTNNYGSTSSDAIMVQSATSYLNISDSTFKSVEPSNFIKASEIALLKIYSSSFKATYNNKTRDFSGLSLTSITSLNLTGNSFYNLNSEKGGAISLSESDTQKTSSSTYKYYINSCYFYNNSASYGGALYLSDISMLYIGSSTKFDKNYAKVQGGAIDFYCSDYGLTNFKKSCSMKIEDTIKFYNNTSDGDGGAIKWNQYEPDMDTTKLVFSNNTATVYGNNIASVAKELKRYTYDSETDTITLSRLLEDSNSTDIYQSGGQINTAFTLIDKYGNIKASDSSSKLYITTIQNSNYKYSQTVNTTQYSIESGIFNVTNLVVVGQPSTSQTLQLSTDGIDTSIYDNYIYYQNASNSLSYYFNFTLRGCNVGEAFLSSGECQTCATGSYLLFAPTTVTSCITCQYDYSECDGGSYVYPLAGYWRSSNTSDNFISCRNEDACLGRNYPTENNTLGACATGYQGILCVDCQIGYSRTGSTYKCSECPSEGANIARLFGLFILLVIGLVLLIRSNLAGSLEKKNYLSVYIRILMNHFQLLTLTASFDLEWPTQLSTFFSATKPVSEASTQFISVDCFIDTRKSNSDPGIIRNFYSKVIMYSMTPFIVIAISYGIWFIIFLFKNRKKPIQPERKTLSNSPKKNGSAQRLSEINQETHRNNKGNDDISISQALQNNEGVDTENAMRDDESKRDQTINGDQFETKKNESMVEDEKEDVIKSALSQSFPSMKTDQEIQNMKKMRQGRIISTVIIVLFLVHPTITTQMFNAFNCEDIDGTSRLYEDLEVKCYSTIHRLIALAIALPSLILWGLGIPSFVLLLIYLRRKELRTIEVKSKYGFLYNGYKEHAFYWEIVIMYRKIVLIFIQVFLAQSGKIVQAMTVLVFLISCLTLNAVKQPFANHKLNGLESISLLSSCVTVYCGIFYIAKSSFSSSEFEMSESSELFLFSLIIISHCIFISYWLYQFIQELRITVRAKAPKVYLFVFLCCRKKKLEKEQQFQAYKEKQAKFIESIEKIMDYYQNKKNQYLQGNVPVEDDQFKRIMIGTRQFVEKTQKQNQILNQEVINFQELLANNEFKGIFKLRPKKEIDIRKIKEVKILAIDQPELADFEYDTSTKKRRQYLESPGISVSSLDQNEKVLNYGHFRNSQFKKQPNESQEEVHVDSLDNSPLRRQLTIYDNNKIDQFVIQEPRTLDFEERKRNERASIKTKLRSGQIRTELHSEGFMLVDSQPKDQMPHYITYKDNVHDHEEVKIKESGKEEGDSIFEYDNIHFISEENAQSIEQQIRNVYPIPPSSAESNVKLNIPLINERQPTSENVSSSDDGMDFEDGGKFQPIGSRTTKAIDQKKRNTQAFMMPQIQQQRGKIIKNRARRKSRMPKKLQSMVKVQTISEEQSNHSQQKIKTNSESEDNLSQQWN